MSQSLRVFRAHMTRTEEHDLVVNEVISRACYLDWLQEKGAGHANSNNHEYAQRFRRSLANHLSGTDGRSPFDEEEEAALLLFLRQRMEWPCFPNALQHLGRPWRCKGYHEKLRAPPAPPLEMEAPPPRALIHSSIDNIQSMMRELDAGDASYLLRLSGHVACNFAQEFTPENQGAIYEIIRFVILGRTKFCCQLAKSAWPNNNGIAQTLCDARVSSGAAEMMAMVCDMTAKPGTNTVLAHSQSILCPTFRPPILQRADFLRVFLAIGAAYHRPGVCFTVTAQEICAVKPVRLDTTYHVDLDTFLLVVDYNPCVE